jgi:hypothetical protein
MRYRHEVFLGREYLVRVNASALYVDELNELNVLPIKTVDGVILTSTRPPTQFRH